MGLKEEGGVNSMMHHLQKQAYLKALCVPGVSQL